MITPRPLLYIAGPYTHPDPVINTHAACRVGTIVYEETDWAPVVPHTTLLWHAITPRPADHWYDLDLHHLARCHAIVRLPGASAGADREVEYALGRLIELLDYEDLPRAARDAWEARHG